MVVNDIYRYSQVHVDWNRDNLFNHALSDISAYVLGLSYKFGMDQAYKEVASLGRMTVELDNSALAWDVENTFSTFGAVFRTGVRVRYRIAVEDPLGSIIFQNQFHGIITGIEVHKDSRNSATLTVEDPMHLLLDAEYYPPLMTNVTTDTVIAAIFDDPKAIAYPYPHRYWMLGVSGSSELGSTTTLYDHDILNAIETGGTTLQYAGHNSDEGNGVVVYRYLQDLVAAEAGGRFFWDAMDNTFVFMSRHYLSIRGLTTYELSQVLDSPPPDYRYGDDVINHVEINYEPKELGTPASVLYTSTNVPFSIAPGQTRTITARYRHPTVENARVGGINMIAPVAGIDYAANTASDGSGSNVTSNMSVSAEFAAQSAQIRVANSAGVTAYITALQLRGTPITTFDREVAISYDADAIAGSSLRKVVMNVPMIDDNEFAEDYARSIVTKFKTARGRVARVTVEMTAMDATFLTHGGIGRIGIRFAFAGFRGALAQTDYMIVGKEGQLIPGGTAGHQARADQYLVTLILEPYVRSVYWTLGLTGRSELDQTTVLVL